MEDRSITLTTKPGASLRISIHTPEQSPADSNSISNPLSDTLVVFLNGLALPRAAWSGAINHLISLRRDSRQPLPAALLSYDRYGQGESDPDPTDLDTPYGHGPEASVADLHQLLTQLCPEILPNSKSLEEARLVLVCNSIGCALARLYAAAHPGRVAGYLFLDSMMANTDFVSLFPADPDGDGDDADLVRHARAAFGEHFHPTVPNPEHLDRRNLAALLPHADRPALPAGPGGRVPRLVVLGHDWDEFAEQCEKGPLSVAKSVINEYVNPAWGAYNEGLTRLVPADRSGEVKIAKGCGHFIQKDDPAFVAKEISDLLNGL